MNAIDPYCVYCSFQITNYRNHDLTQTKWQPRVTLTKLVPTDRNVGLTYFTRLPVHSKICTIEKLGLVMSDGSHTIEKS
jgi:hypothetical protein